jgi:hypothetical protein
MSPEQVQSSRDVDPRTDVWALGCVLYTSLTGRAPHQHLGSIGQILVAICTTPAPPLAEVAPWVPPEVAAIVHRALERDPEARYPSAGAMLAAIRRLLPEGALTEASLAPAGEKALAPASAPPAVGYATPRVVVRGSDRPVRGDEVTELGEPPGHERSAVPAVGTRATGRYVTVDPRPFLGDSSEVWTFSLEVHPNVSSLVARVYRALRRAGGKVEPRSYGTSWVLFEPRTDRAIMETLGGDGARTSLDAAGIRTGGILWVVRPESRAGISSR